MASMSCRAVNELPDLAVARPGTGAASEAAAARGAREEEARRAEGLRGVGWWRDGEGGDGAKGEMRKREACDGRVERSFSARSMQGCRVYHPLHPLAWFPAPMRVVGGGGGTPSQRAAVATRCLADRPFALSLIPTLSLPLPSTLSTHRRAAGAMTGQRAERESDIVFGR